MPWKLPAIDEAYHHASRQPKALAASYGFMALLLILIWTNVLPLPTVHMTVTLVAFGFMGLLTTIAYRTLGYHSNLYRLADLSESSVFLLGLAVTMNAATSGLPLAWAFYLLFCVMVAQHFGRNIYGLIIVLSPVAGLIFYQSWADTLTEVNRGYHISGLLLSGGLFLFFGNNRQDQLELTMSNMQAERELAIARMAIDAQTKVRRLDDDWLAILANMVSALVLVDADLHTVDVRGDANVGLDIKRELDAGFLRELGPSFAQAEQSDTAVVLFGKSVPSKSAYVDVRIVALPLSERKERYAVLIQDATARVSLEETNRKLTQQMVVADKLNSVGVMAAGIGHEINNPLGYVLGNVEYLLEIEQISGAARASLLDMQSGLKDIESIVGDLKGFSHNASTMYRQTADICDLAKRASRLVRADVNRRAVFTFDLPNHPLFVRCQPERIQQIIVNLLINATQAIPEGAEGRIGLAIAEEGHQVVLRISDNGIGMSEEVQRKIFDIFYTTKAPGKGTGLGLSIAFSLAQEHNGSLSVVSAPGAGSTFSLCLPLTGTPKAQISLLVVDDEERALQLYSRALSNFKVTTASSIGAALELMSQEFQVVLCDIRLPDGSGLDLYEQAPVYMKNRFVFLTALPPETPELKDRPHGVPLLHKPINLKDLEQELYGAARKISS
jgi:signal transduction histidine kinase/CheY-like chemotaxis protein